MISEFFDLVCMSNKWENRIIWGQRNQNTFLNTKSHHCQISAVQSDIKRTLEERETKMREMTVMHWTLIIIIIILENAFVLLQMSLVNMLPWGNKGQKWLNFHTTRWRVRTATKMSTYPGSLLILSKRFLAYQCFSHVRAYPNVLVIYNPKEEIMKEISLTLIKEKVKIVIVEMFPASGWL